MSRLIELSAGQGRFIDPDDVSEVTVNPGANVITVHARNGIGYSVSPDYGRGVYETADLLVKRINDARTKVFE